MERDDQGVRALLYSGSGASRCEVKLEKFSRGTSRGNQEQLTALTLNSCHGVSSHVRMAIVAAVEAIKSCCRKSKRVADEENIKGIWTVYVSRTPEHY